MTPETATVVAELLCSLIKKQNKTKKTNFVGVFVPIWLACPLKTKRIFKQNKTKQRARARWGSHLRNNATVKLDCVPNGWDAPRTSLRCYAGEKAAAGHIMFSVYPSICPRALTRAQSTSASEHVSHCCVEKTLTFVTALRPGPEEPEEPEEPAVLWPLRDVSFVPCQHKRTDGRASRRHLSVGGELRLNRGHLITLSQWPEIKNVLLCLCFCHDLKPGRTGNNSPLHACEKRRWCTRYSTKVAGWKCFIAWPLCWQPALMENFVRELFPLSVLWTAASCGRYPEAQREAKQHK